MKLYTEEQVMKAIELARLIQEKGSVEDSFDVESISGMTEICTYGWSERHSKDEIMKSLTPIELPSDEEIENKSKHWGLASDFFYKGANWVIEQIKKQVIP